MADYPPRKNCPVARHTGDQSKWSLAKVRSMYSKASHSELVLGLVAYAGLCACTGKETYQRRTDILEDELLKRLEDNDG